MKLSMNDREMAENQARTWKKPALQSSTGSSTTLSNATDKAVAVFFPQTDAIPSSQALLAVHQNS